MNKPASPHCVFAFAVGIAFSMIALGGLTADRAAAAQSGHDLTSAPGDIPTADDAELRIAKQLEDGVAAARRGDFETALSLWRPIAEDGNAEAQYALGIMHINGKGVAKSDAEAVRWFRMSAEQGFLDAQYNLGVAYLAGDGAPQDEVEAAKWFQLAARQDQVAAQFNLGRAYSIGQGVERDVVLAHMWLSLSVARGNHSAGLVLDRLKGEMTQDEIAEAERLAKEWRPLVER